MLLLPDDLTAFVDAQVRRTGCGDARHYLASLVRAARERVIADHLTALLQIARPPPSEPHGPGAGSHTAVDILPMADADKAAIADSYAASGLAAIAARFLEACRRTMTAIGEGTTPGETCPDLGEGFPGPVAWWTVRGFSDHRIYAVNQDGQWRVLRILHRVRDIEAAAADPV